MNFKPHIDRKPTSIISRRLSIFILLLSCLLGGCGLLQQKEGMDPAEADAVQGASPEWGGEPIPYKVQIDVRDISKDVQSSLKGKMAGASQLVHLIKEPPDSLLALERRARLDTKTALDLLHSEGYYDGKAWFQMQETTPAAVTLFLEPGRRYTLRQARIEYLPSPHVPEAFKNRTRPAGFLGLQREPLPPPRFADTVPGLEPGLPVTASRILSAVEKLPEGLRRKGYPLARIARTEYTLDRTAHELDALVIIEPGSPALMGAVKVLGNEDVDAEYLQNIVPWTMDHRPWNSDVVEDYANTLRGLGLFRTVEVRPLADAAEPLEDGLVSLPAEVVVQERPFRTISGSARYSTGTGFGLEAGWEHRNLFHNGEKLTITTPFATEIQGIKAAFEKPAFLSPKQRFLASASALREDTDAYLKEGISVGAGMERRFSRRWWGGFGLSGESGYLKDNEHKRQDYSILRPEVHLRFDSRNNVLDPVRGAQVEARFSPFSGFYGESFSAWAGTLATNLYYAPLRDDKDRPDDFLVLAARLEGGFMSGSELRKIPSNLRYFAGGASTVRGYTYQSIGPRDREDDPLGGRSYQLVNLEARFKITEDVGIVPFVDGGMVYKDEYPHIIGDMDWGAGLGLRYFTPIGPLRFDVATPLRRDEDDAPLQFYISIGQSF